MIRKRAEKDTVNPPGSVRFGTLQQEIVEWETIQLAKKLYDIWRKAPDGSDVFMLMAQHAKKRLDKDS